MLRALSSVSFPALADHGSLELDSAAKRCRRRVRLVEQSGESCAVPFFWTHWIDAVTRNKRADRSATTPKAWWQRVLAGEPMPKDLFKQKSKCGGTVEDHRNIALDVRELIRHRVFDQPVGSIFGLNMGFLTHHPATEAALPALPKMDLQRAAA